MGTKGSEKDGKDKRREIPLAKVFEEQNNKGKMTSERRTLKSSLAGLGLEGPGNPRRSYREMQRTNVGVSAPADGSLKQGGSSLFKPLSG